MVQANKKSSLLGVLWSSADKFGIVLFQFLINLVLARLLTPEEFGCVGMIMIFIVMSQILIDGGFTTALIQRINPSQQDYSTIFYWNIVFSLFLYLIIFLTAPAVGDFFRMPLLVDILRVLGLMLIINSLWTIQKTFLRKHLELRKIATTNLTAYAISAVTAIAMAYYGFGAWSLVGMMLVNTTATAILYWLQSKWRPSWTFSFQALKEMFFYGGYILFTNLMQGICTQIQGVLIGRYFSPAQTGLYAQAKKMDDISSTSFPDAVIQVVFPLYSQHQNNTDALRDLLRKNHRMVSFILYPILTLLVLISPQLITFLFGEKWIGAAECFQILCIGGFFSCIYNFNYYAVAALGKSRLLFQVAIYKWTLLLALLLVAAQISLNAVLWAMVISNANIYLTNGLLSQRYVKYTLAQQIQDVLPCLLCAGASLVLVWGIQNLMGGHWTIIVGVFLLFYISSSFLFHLRAFSELSESFRTFILRR